MTLAAVVAVVCMGLFVLGLLAPRTSRRVQSRIDATSRDADSRLQHSGKPGSHRAEKTTELADRAVDASSHAGRKIRRRE